MEKKTIQLSEQGDKIIATQNAKPISDANGIKDWSNEKVAVQWIKRQAEKNKEDVEIIRPNGDFLYAAFSEPTHKNATQHAWKKANVMALADARGRYNKLVCEHCGFVVRHYYTRERHFLEEFQYCKPKDTTK